MPETNDVISHLYYDLNDKIDNLDQRLDAIDVEASTEPKVYVALLTQTGTDAPVAAVLKNTLGGEVVWSYSAVGTYIGTLASAFTTNKTIIITPYIRDYTAEPLLTILAERVSVNAIEVYTGTLNNVTGDEFIKFNTGNSILNATFIKIEVYP